MNKVRNLFLAFAIVGLLMSISMKEAQAGCPPTPQSDCVACCKEFCDAGPGKIDCSGLKGEDRQDCNLFRNIAADCCLTDCKEASCGVDSDNKVCEAIESFCF